jgi:hypothetical protein
MAMAKEELMEMAQLGGNAKVVIDLGYVYIFIIHRLYIIINFP